MANNYLSFNRSLLAMAALQALPLSLFAQNTGEKPNILYIMCDDHAIQAISAYGSAISQLAPTPNIDRLAERGMKFNEAFVENSLSTPSRACLMTGLYSHQNGQRMLAEGIDSTKTFFSEMLQKAGYETAVVGKWHMSCRPKGFDFYHILNDQGQYYNPTFASTDHYGEYKQEWDMPPTSSQTMPSNTSTKETETSHSVCWFIIRHPTVCGCLAPSMLGNTAK